MPNLRQQLDQKIRARAIAEAASTMEDEVKPPPAKKNSIARTNSIMSVKHLICMVGLPARGKTYISKVRKRCILHNTLYQ